MKRSTLIAIAVAVVGIGLVVWLMSRPRAGAAATTAASSETPPDTEETTAAAGRAARARVVEGVGTGLAGIAGALSGLA